MEYLDTNIILAYPFDSQSSHEISREVIEKLKDEDREDFCTSTYSILECYNAVKRKPEDFELPVRRSLSLKLRVSTIVKYALQELDIKIISDNVDLEDESYNDNDISMIKLYKWCISKSCELKKMKSGDMLQVAHANKIKEEGIDITSIVSLDPDFSENKDEIENVTSIEVITPEDN